MDLAGNTLATHSVYFTIQAPPTWSPDGTKVVCITVGANGNGSAICVVDVASGVESSIYQPISTTGQTSINHKTVMTPVWEPNGDRIAFVLRTSISNFQVSGRSDDVAVVSADGGGFKEITDSPYGKRISELAWSPDGTEIAYSTHSVSGDPIRGIFRVQVDGGVEQQITESATFTGFQWVNLNPGPTYKVTAIPEKPHYAIDDSIAIEFKVTHRGEGAATYQFDNTLYTLEPAPEEGVTQVLSFGEVEELEPFVLSPDDPEKIILLPAEINKPGVLKLLSTVSVQPDEGEPYTLEAEEKVVVSPLSTTVTITNQEHLLNQTPESDWSELAQQVNADRRAAEQDSYANLIEIKLEVTNSGEDNLENVNVPGALDVLSLISSTNLESPGVPMTPIRLIKPDGSVIDLTSPDPEITVEDVTVEPGSMVTYSWILDAFDANPDPESDDSAELEMKALVLGSLQGENVQSLATEEFSIVERVLLKWGIKPRDGRTNYVSGQSVWVDAYIENVSAESGFPKDLLVMVFQTPEGNVGGGYMVEHGQNLAQMQPRDDPDFYQFFVLPSDGETKKDLQAFFRTLETQEPSQGHVEYDVRVWTIAEDDSLTSADDQALLNEDEGWKREFDVSLAANFLSDRSILIEECLESGELPWLCGMAEGIYNKLGPGLVDLAAYGIDLSKQTYNLSILMASEYAQSMVDLWKGIKGDEAALAAFTQEIYVQYLTMVELGVILGEGGSKTPMAVKQFGDLAVETFADFMFKLETGNAEERQLIIGEFLGANPDLALEPLIALRGFRNMRLAMHEIADGVSDNYVAAAQKQRADKDLASAAKRVEDAFDAGKDAAKALRAGDELTQSMLSRIYGISKKQLEDLQNIAEKFDVVLTFRSRNPRSVELLERAVARPKPQALKHKGINDIDVEYLGYPGGDDLATVGVVEPPKSLQGITDDETLRKAIDDYVGKLAEVHPKLADDDVLRYEVADRLKTRVEEWDELVPRNPDTDEVLETYKISVSFDAQTQFASKAGKTIKADDVRTVKHTAIESITDPVTGDTRRRYRLTTTGPASEGAEAGKFKAITGDVDFLAILEPNGTMIKDAKRRIEIYEALASTIGMQHGESFTFFLQKAREKYIRCCVAGAPDAEAMVAIGPGARQTSRAAFFVDNMSLMPDGPNTRFLGAQKKLRDRYFRVVRKKGEPVRIRREDVSGEFILLDGYPQSLALKQNFLSYFQPKIYRQLLKEWFQRFIFFSPSYVTRVLNGNESETQSLPVKQSASMTPRSEEITIFNLHGPILQIDESVDLESLRQWTESAGWQPIERANALYLGDPETADMAPMTALSEYAESGSQELEVLNLDELEASGRFFESGDRVIIDPGQPHEEYAVVAFTEPFTLTGPLVFDHDSGAMIAFLEADVIDSDGDNLTDGEESQLGTSPTLADTDGDGLKDNEEILYGTDPLDSRSRFELADVLMENESENLLLSWRGSANKTYTIEGSYDLKVWFELDTTTATEDGIIEAALNFGAEEGVSRFIRLRLSQSSDSSQNPDEKPDYHQWLLEHLEADYGLTGGEWITGSTETEAMATVFTPESVTRLNIQVEDLPFTQALNLKNAVMPANHWNDFVHFKSQKPISSGNTLLLIAWVRGIDIGEGLPTINHGFELATSPYTGIVYRKVVTDGDWQQYLIPMEANLDLPDSWYKIHLGFAVQEVDVGGVAVLNYGDKYTIDQLPKLNIP